MKLMTAVDITKNLPSIVHTNRLLIMGSCFSDTIGERLKCSGFRADINPYGVLYNPLSIVRALSEIKEGKVYGKDDVFEYGGLWHSRMHHGSFSCVDKQQTINGINERLQQAHRELRSIDRLFITFGTAYAYFDKQMQMVVSNCHKISDAAFLRKRLSVDEITASLIGLFDGLISDNQKLKIVLTVSPIRHLRDGLHENQLSKATLLLAIDKLLTCYPDNVSYFPAYEILMDELRDYRYYADDMMHPSDLAADYIWERFSESTMDEQTRSIAKECENIYKALSHRPLHPEEKAYKEFLVQLTLKIELLKKKYPYLELKI